MQQKDRKFTHDFYLNFIVNDFNARLLKLGTPGFRAAGVSREAASQRRPWARARAHASERRSPSFARDRKRFTGINRVVLGVR
jgi:hypothetical protein